MAIVYRHRRLDTNEVFYIGIGKSTKRAYTKDSRNAHWHNVVNKCGYEVDIIIEGISEEKAKELEKSLIFLYGRKDLNLGELVNKTSGGDGILEYSHTDEARRKISEAGIGRENETQAVRVEQYDLLGNYIKTFKSISEASKVIGVSRKNIYNVCIGINKSSANYFWKYEGVESEGLKNILEKGFNNSVEKPVIQLNLNNEVVNTFDSIRIASDETSIERRNINTVCKGRRKTAGGYIWKYKNEINN